MESMQEITSPFLDDAERHVFDPRLAVEIGVEGAIIVQRIHFFSRACKHVWSDRNGVQRSWIWNTYEDWSEDHFHYWSLASIRRFFDGLREKGILIVEQFGAWDRKTKTVSGSNRQLWYAINYIRLNEIYAQKYMPRVQAAAFSLPDDAQSSDNEDDIFGDQYRRNVPRKPAGATKTPVKAGAAPTKTGRQGELHGSDPMVKAIIAWWSSHEPGKPGGIVDPTGVNHAKKVAKIAYDQGWSSDLLIENLQGTYEYLWNKPADPRSGWSWQGNIHIGVFIKQMPMWATQVKTKPAVTPAQAYVPIAPKRRSV